MTKILWHSNGPHTPTGYGVQTALFLPLLAESHSVTCSAFYGLEGSPITWRGIEVLPSLGGDWGNDTLPEHAKRVFGGDPRGGLVVTLCDVWPFSVEMARGLNMACWTPVDHMPAPEKVTDFLAQSGAVPIAMSRFGEQQLGLLDPLYVPHGVDTEVYRPHDRQEIRKDRFPTNAFVVGMVAANKGHPSRKAFSQALEAFARFASAHDDAFLYLHTVLDPNIGQGVNIPALLRALGIPLDRVRIADQYSLLYRPHPPRDMAQIYSAFDVLLSPSFGEGFGVCVLEAQACFPAGTPVQVEDPVAVQCRPYSGCMVTIETARGSFEATADHPVWTQRGWQSAGSVRPGDQVLYSHAPERMVKVHAGPIEEVARSLQHHDTGGSSSFGWDDDGIGVLQLAESGLDAEALCGAHRDQAGPYDRLRASLSRGADRWRGHGDAPNDQSWPEAQFELQTIADRVQHGQADDGLDYAARVRGLARHTAADPSRHGQLPMLHRGTGPASALSGASAFAGAQRRLAGGGYRVVRDPLTTVTAGPLDDSTARDHLADPRTEYDTVTTVSERHVRDLPVYNFTTRSGVYGVGAGYLVHNCGVPAIVTNWTAMPEVCGAGWHVDHHPYWSGLNAWQAIPKIDDIVAALEECHALSPARREKLSQMARKHALDYDAKRVVREYWLPVLRAAEQRFSASSKPVTIPSRLKAVAA